MNFILHKHNKTSNWFGIPDGLTDLLSDITREILREQPDNIYEFTAEYLEAMLIIREHAASMLKLFPKNNFERLIFFCSGKTNRRFNNRY